MLTPMPTQRYTEKRGANHALHVFLSIITCGIWAITGWPIAAILGRKTTTTVPIPPAQQYPPQQQYGPPPPQQGYQAPPYYGPQQPPPPPQRPPGPYGPPRP